MSGTFGNLMTLAVETVRDPREGAKAILALDWPREALLLALGVVIAFTGVLGVLDTLLLPSPPELPEGAGFVTMPPLLLAVFAYLVTVGYAWAVGWFGRKIGGTGSTDQALALFVFLQFVFTLAQVAIFAVTILLPPLAALLLIVAFIWAIWMTIAFIDVLHGFGSLLKSFLLSVAVSTALAIAGMFVLGLAGVGAGGPA